MITSEEEDLLKLFCPKCRGEFREGYVFCRKCNTDLVDELPPIEAKKEISYTQNPETFLVSVFDDYEAKIVESLLRAYDIPILRRYNGLGHYVQLVWGFSVFGIAIYVPEKALAFALEILENKSEDQDVVITDLEEVEADSIVESYQEIRKYKRWFFMLIYFFEVVGFFIIIFYGLYLLVRYRKRFRL